MAKQVFFQRFAHIAEGLVVLVVHRAQGVVCFEYVARAIQLIHVAGSGFLAVALSQLRAAVVNIGLPYLINEVI